MSTTTNKTVRKMSNEVIAIELRAAWIDVERDLRHGVQPSKSNSDYIAALTAEQVRRG